MLNLKFPVKLAKGERLKIAKNHYFALVFSSSKLISSAVTSKWIEIEQKAFQRWLHVILRST
jgi:hypothetical protein